MQRIASWSNDRRDTKRIDLPTVAEDRCEGIFSYQRFPGLFVTDDRWTEFFDGVRKRIMPDIVQEGRGSEGSRVARRLRFADAGPRPAEPRTGGDHP